MYVQIVQCATQNQLRLASVFHECTSDKKIIKKTVIRQQVRSINYSRQNPCHLSLGNVGKEGLLHGCHGSQLLFNGRRLVDRKQNQ